MKFKIGRVKNYRQWEIAIAFWKIEFAIEVHGYFHGIRFDLGLSVYGLSVLIEPIFGGIGLWIGKRSTCMGGGD